MSKVLFQNQSVYQLRNAGSVCHISPQNGARLIDWKINNTAIIHWPDDADWSNIPHVRGGNPILFPFVGRHMVNGKIGFWKDENDVVRELPMHGFARELPFDVIDETPNTLQMRLSSNDSTRAMYPFEFTFDVIYELGQTSLKSTFVTHNIGENSLPYCAGHHFYLDILHGDRANWQINLPCGRWGWQNPSDGSITLAEAESTETTLADNAIIDRFHMEFTQPKVLLCKNNQSITFSWSANDPWFDVTTWTLSPDADFYCVEPWLGLPNAIHSKLGLRWIAAGQTETASCEIAINGG